MLPPDQRFQPDDAAADHLDLRLVLANELRRFALHRLDELDTQLNFARGTLVADRVEEAELIAAVALCLIHRCVGVFQQRAHIASVFREQRDADRCGHLRVDGRHKIGAIQRLRNPRRE